MKKNPNIFVFKFHGVLSVGDKAKKKKEMVQYKEKGII